MMLTTLYVLLIDANNDNSVTPCVVSLPEVIREPVNDILREPLWKVKAKPQNKHTYLSSCLRDNTYPKKVTPKVPLKIIDPPRELSVRWKEILHECGTSHWMTEMAQIEPKAAEVIQDAMCELIL